MSTYLARLKAALAQNAAATPTDKTDESPSVGFVGDQGRRVPTDSDPLVGFVGDSNRLVSANGRTEPCFRGPGETGHHFQKTPTSPTDKTDESCGEGCGTTGAATSVGFVGEPNWHVSVDAIAQIARLPCPSICPIVEAIRSAPSPADEPPARFERARQGALRFAAEHAADAIRFGWTHDELFALTEPFANLSRQGAAWFIRDSSVAAVSAAAITIRTAGGATTRIYRKTLH